jgi:hypothetical protein
MAATTTRIAVPGIRRTQAVSPTRTNRRRNITPEAGHALEMLGHAIEYLTDEYVFEAKQISANDPQVQAIRLLMALNRQIYFACPVVPTFAERLRTFFHVAAP